MTEIKVLSYKHCSVLRTYLEIMYKISLYVRKKSSLNVFTLDFGVLRLPKSVRFSPMKSPRYLRVGCSLSNTCLSREVFEGVQARNSLLSKIFVIRWN